MVLFYQYTLCPPTLAGGGKEKMAQLLPSRTQVIQAYRNLYRGLLHAVQYSSPARFTARDRVRLAFRRGTIAEYDQTKINRTIEFLDLAAKETGMEHRIVKNLLHVWYWEKDRVIRSRS